MEKRLAKVCVPDSPLCQHLWQRLSQFLTRVPAWHLLQGTSQSSFLVVHLVLEVVTVSCPHASSLPLLTRLRVLLFKAISLDCLPQLVS